MGVRWKALNMRCCGGNISLPALYSVASWASSACQYGCPNSAVRWRLQPASCRWQEMALPPPAASLPPVWDAARFTVPPEEPPLPLAGGLAALAAAGLLFGEAAKRKVQY